MLVCEGGGAAADAVAGVDVPRSREVPADTAAAAGGGPLRSREVLAGAGGTEEGAGVAVGAEATGAEATGA